MCVFLNVEEFRSRINCGDLSAMFEHDMEEKKNSRVEVKDVEAEVMADMLR